MNKQEVINEIGEKNWDSFCKFIRGQGLGFKDGVIDYYECDVNRFITKHLIQFRKSLKVNEK